MVVVLMTAVVAIIVATVVAVEIDSTAIIVNHAENLAQHHYLKILLLTRIEVVTVFISECHGSTVAII